MITVGSFQNICSEYDEVWCIVRSLKKMPECQGVVIRHVPELSPSWELFSWYLTMKRNGKWNEECFLKKYVPKFLSEMHGAEAQEKMSELYELGKNKSVLLVCYCSEESMCHRSIVLGLLQGMAKEENCIELVGEDYSSYYVQFRALDNIFTRSAGYAKWKRECLFYLLIAGSREFCGVKEFCDVVDRFILEHVPAGMTVKIISGGARGTDTMAELYANQREYESKVMKADWNKYGNRAGFLRNEQMHQYIAVPSGNKRACLCFWDMESRGTKHNFRLAREWENPLWVWNTVEHRYLTEEEIESLV